MAGELTVSPAQLAALVDGQGLTDALKPLVKKIHLFDTYVAGTTHLPDAAVLQHIEPGQELLLQRESNKFDPNAILVLTRERVKIGYIPERDNLVFARLMDAGKLLAARVGTVTCKGSFTQIAIGIDLVDF